MNAFDGLAVVEAALGLTRVEACMPPHVPVPRPGPCKGAKRAAKKVADAVAGPKPAKRAAAKKTAKAAVPKKAVYGDELLRVLPVTVDTATGPAPARATPPPAPAAVAAVAGDPEQAEYAGPRFELSNEDRQRLERYTEAKKISDGMSWDDDETSMDDYVDAQNRTEDTFDALPAPLQRRVRQEEFITSEFEQHRTGKTRPPGAATMRASQVKQLSGLFKGKQIAIRTTPLALGKILEDGRFKTQHETGTGGAVASYIPERRAELEAQVWGIPERGFPPGRRPVYGYVAVNGITPAGGDTGLDQHGSVQVILKPSVRARTTAMVGDSYDQRTLARPSPVNDPQWWSYNTRQSQDSAAKHVASDFFKNWSYVEAQIHDGVSVGDIAEVVLPSAPSAALKKQLESKGVPWRVLPGRSS